MLFNLLVFDNLGILKCGYFVSKIISCEKKYFSDLNSRLNIEKKLNGIQKYRIAANSFRTCMYCYQRSHYIRLNSKKNSFRGNYSRKYGLRKKLGNCRLIFRLVLENLNSYLCMKIEILLQKGFGHICKIYIEIQGVFSSMGLSIK